MQILFLSIIITLLILLEGFFSGSEIGLISLNRIKLRYLVEARVKRAQIINKILSHPDRMLATTLVGTNISVIIASALFANIAIKTFGMRGQWLTTLIMSPIILIFGELVPKTLFRQRADQLVLSASGPLLFFSKLFYPASFVIAKVSNFIMAILGQNESKKKSLFVTREELRYLVQESEREGVIKPHERIIIYNIFDFAGTKVKEIMIPHGRIVSLKSSDTVGDLRAKLMERNFSNIPVWETDPSNFIGVVDALEALAQGDSDSPVSDYIKPAVFLSQDMSIDTVLMKLQAKRHSLAILVDENNKSRGMVTVEDLLEEIVGEI